MMITYDKLECTIYFHWIVDFNCNDNNIVFIISYQCFITSETITNVSLHGSTVILYSSIMIAYDKHECTINFHCIAEIICFDSWFINSYQCAIILEMTLHKSLHYSNCNNELRHFLL